MELPVDAARISRELDTLAGFTDDPAPAVTRVVYTPTDLKARAYVRALLREAGLTLREDGLGNLFARWEGARPELSAVATGSHLDAIPHAGRFDGTVGVLGALEAFRALRAAGFVPLRPLELVVFTSEEPTRFGVGCLGSRALAGVLTPEQLAALRDADGVSVPEAARAAGFTAPLEAVALRAGHFHAFVELHIEQGPQLEAAGVPIGVVTAIAAPATLHLTLTGSGGHAGAVLMRGRRDALLAAAEVALAVEAAALATEDPDTVATVGILDVHPRAVNAIPNRAFLTVDARDTHEGRRDALVARIRADVQEVAERRGLRPRSCSSTPTRPPPATPPSSPLPSAPPQLPVSRRSGW